MWGGLGLVAIWGCESCMDRPIKARFDQCSYIADAQDLVQCKGKSGLDAIPIVREDYVS